MAGFIGPSPACSSAYRQLLGAVVGSRGHVTHAAGTLPPLSDLKDTLSTPQPTIEGEDTRAIVWLDIDKFVCPFLSSAQNSRLASEPPKRRRAGGHACG